MPKTGRGKTGWRYTVRLPVGSTEELENFAQQGGYGSRTDVIYEAVEEFQPLLGKVPLYNLGEEGFDDSISIRYGEDDEFGDFLSKAEESEFATKAEAVRNAIALKIGEIDYDIEERIEALESLQEEHPTVAAE